MSTPVTAPQPAAPELTLEPAARPAPASPRTTLMIVALAVTVANLALLQTLVVPVLSMIAEQLDASLAAVGWVLTANLLAAAVLTPVLGRLGDVYGKRSVMLGILTAV